MLLIRSITDCLAPSPTASMATTEPTPMTMPSSVRKVRKMLALSERRAMRSASAVSPIRVPTGWLGIFARPGTLR